jgi:peptide/nickel transport system substrate-binding protein
MWRKIRFYLHLFRAFTGKYWLAISTSIILGILAFWLLPRISTKFPRPKKTISIGIIGQYNQNNLPSSILNQVSLGLTQIDSQGKPFPGLAETWETHNQGKEWLFQLDPKISWSDRQPVKSRDLKFNFKDVQIQYPAENQILFQLQDPFSPFPSVLSQPILRSDLIGIGPYKFSTLSQSGPYINTIKLTPVNKTSASPNLQYKFYGTEEAAKTAFKLGEIDQINDLINPREFQTWPGININAQTKPYRYVALFFNINNPNFKEKSTRQSLAYVIKDKSFSHQRIISPIMDESWAHNPHVKPYEYDPERAKTLWGEFELPENAAIQISTVPSLLNIAEQIATDWQAIPVPAEVKIINAIPEDFDVLLVTQEVPTDPDQYVLWHSTQPTNITHYQNPKIDKLLEDGRKEIDQEKRLEIYQEFQRTLLEDLPVIFLFRPITYTISRK